VLPNRKQAPSICLVLASAILQGQKFFIWGYSLGALTDEVPRKLKHFADIVYTNFDCRNDQNLKNSHITPTSLCFTVEGYATFCMGLPPPPSMPMIGAPPLILGIEVCE